MNSEILLVKKLTGHHNLHEVLPSIDKHNRMRPNILGLEKKRLKKDFWFRLITTASRLIAVDMDR